MYRSAGIWPCFKIDDSLISTGGGDNFNAGFCLGLLMQLSLPDSLTVGMATSSYYVKYGKSPEIEDLIEYMELSSS